MRHPDVIIVGAGPVGLTAANLLGQFGVRTLVLDRAPDILPYPRAVAIDDESLRVIQSIGLVDAFRKDVIENNPIKYLSANGRVLVDMKPTTRRFGWFPRNMFMQQLAEATLAEGVRRWESVEVRRAATVTAFAQTSVGVQVTVEYTDQPENEVISASLLLACDGARSTIRDLLGIALVGKTYRSRWLVIESDVDPIDAPYSALHCDPARPYYSGRLPHGNRRWEFMVLPGEDDAQVLSDEGLRAIVGRVVPDFDALHITRARVYTHHTRIAERIAEGRVLLLGDAAHLMPPWAGQGLNSGIRDAMNAAWKVTATLRGWGGGDLLATYQQERHGHAAAMIKLSYQLGAVFTPRNRIVAWCRDLTLTIVRHLPGIREYLYEMRFKRVPSYDNDLVIPTADTKGPGVAGSLFPQPLVEQRGEELLLDGVLGTWFSLITFRFDAGEILSDDDLAYLKEAGVTPIRVERARADVDRLAGPETVQDLYGDLGRWFDGNRVAAVILRPDHFVLGASTAEGLPHLIARMRSVWTAAGQGVTTEVSGRASAEGS